MKSLVWNKKELKFDYPHFDEMSLIPFYWAIATDDENNEYFVTWMPNERNHVILSQPTAVRKFEEEN